MAQPQSFDLKAIERRAFRATFQDGLWDIYLGLVFVAFGLGPVLRHTAGLSERSAMIVHIGILAVALIMLIGGKKYITMPRLGCVRFGPARKRKLSRARIVLALSVVTGMIALVGVTGDDLGLTGLAILFAVNILVVLGALAYFMDFNRLFYYAVLWAISFPLGLLLEEHAGLGAAPTVFLVTGGLAVVVGGVYFARFLRDYALPPGGEAANGLA